MSEPSKEAREAARKRFFSDYQFWLSADMPGSVWNEVRDFITDTVIPHTIEECQRAIAAAEERARAEQAETISAQAAEIEGLRSALDRIIAEPTDALELRRIAIQALRKGQPK